MKGTNLCKVKPCSTAMPVYSAVYMGLDEHRCWHPAQSADSVWDSPNLVRAKKGRVTLNLKSVRDLDLTHLSDNKLLINMYVVMTLWENVLELLLHKIYVTVSHVRLFPVNWVAVHISQSVLNHCWTVTVVRIISESQWPFTTQSTTGTQAD